MLHDDGYKNVAWLAGGFSKCVDGDFADVEGESKLQYATIGGVCPTSSSSCCCCSGWSSDPMDGARNRRIDSIVLSIHVSPVSFGSAISFSHVLRVGLHGKTTNVVSARQWQFLSGLGRQRWYSADYEQWTGSVAEVMKA
ncbi:hypothetical protein PR202_gb19500 [Eleusine coracana subsp. coracana]|uniref:Uncharacterized protein n=1 Tax=Eleusine coracana subsp. coracana TaxID=191504 RepID=A0AAV5FA22_ELECO|nr:hypothetical protein PR202_gb19500 [Eleusine coracana subsp. coracana]